MNLDSARWLKAKTGTELRDLEQTIILLEKTLQQKKLSKYESEGLLRIISDYMRSWILLQKYDNGSLGIPETKKEKKPLLYDEAIFSLTKLKNELIKKNEAGDIFGASISASENPPQSKNIDSAKVLTTLRKEINKRFMSKGFGLTQLTSRPWEDYICPESSNFTWDVN